MTKAKQPYTILGRMIGLASGWDMTGDWEMFFYDFEPALNVRIPSGDLAIDYEAGLFKKYDDEGNVSWQADVVDILKDFPLCSP